MDSNDRLRKRLHTQHALAVAVEPLALGRRIGLFGDASMGLAALLIERGARAVTVWDPDRSRAVREAERAPRGVTVRSYSADDPGPRAPDPRAVELVIVPDLGILDDPSDLLARVRGMVGERGVAVIAAENGEGEASDAAEPSGAFDYYDLFDRVAREFESVRMIAQLPFFGVALMELGGEDDAPAVNVDTRLADAGRTPEAFVVVASQERDRVLEAYSIVELPAPPPPIATAIAAAPVEDDPVLRVALVEARLRGDVLANQLDEARARADKADLAARESGVTAREEARRAAAKVDEVAQRLDLAESRAAALEVVLARQGAQGDAAPGAEFGRLEEGLRESARAVRSLHAEVARRDQIVRDLVSALDEADVNAAAEDESLRPRLDALALDLARREGDAKASAWRIQELERQLAQASVASSVASIGSAESSALTAALDELETLRRAFVQEHDARRAAEAGLTKLRGV